MATKLLPQYKSHKIVEAMRIAEILNHADASGAELRLVAGDGPEAVTAVVMVNRAYLVKHSPQVGGYYIRYPDGYESWSPAESFEGAYTGVDPIDPGTLTTGQPKITGYRNLGQAETDLMNEGKALAEQCGVFIAKLRGLPPTHPGCEPSNTGRLTLDQRWISIGATQLQQGFMAVIRGIAQPTTF